MKQGMVLSHLFYDPVDVNFFQINKSYENKCSGSQKKFFVLFYDFFIYAKVFRVKWQEPQFEILDT